MEQYIKKVFKDLDDELSIVEIHDKLIKLGLSEEDTFLVIQAGLLLFEAMFNLDEELKQRKSKQFTVKRSQ
jgi:hypothetical protein